MSFYATEDHSRPRKIKVLFVDDNAGSLSHIHGLLSDSHIDVELQCVTTFFAAISAFSSSDHDVAIIDSPEGNGRELLHEARSVACGFPIIVLTSASASEALNAIHAGAADCLVRDELSATTLERTICFAIERASLDEYHTQNERRYLGLIENTSEIIYTHDFDGRYTSVNRAVLNLTGYTQQEALALNVSQVVAPEFLDRAKAMFSRKVVEQTQTHYEAEIVTKEGAHIPVDISSHLIFKQGKPIAVQGIVSRTDRRKG